MPFLVFLGVAAVLALLQVIPAVKRSPRASSGVMAFAALSCVIFTLFFSGFGVAGVPLAVLVVVATAYGIPRQFALAEWKRLRQAARPPVPAPSKQTDQALEMALTTVPDMLFGSISTSLTWPTFVLLYFGDLEARLSRGDFSPDLVASERAYFNVQRSWGVAVPFVFVLGAFALFVAARRWSPWFPATMAFVRGMVSRGDERTALLAESVRLEPPQTTLFRMRRAHSEQAPQPDAQKIDPQ